jgi:hypothetical protein
MSELPDVVATVDAMPDNIAVWWTYVGPPRPRLRSRMVGAWVLPVDDTSTLTNLLAQRILWATAAGSDAITGQPGPRLDVPGTLTALHKHVDHLHQVFNAEQDRRSKSTKMIEPHWPTLPAPVDPENLTGHDVPAVGRALAMSRWLSVLCGQWEELEAARLARPLLRRTGASTAQPLPLVAA